MPSLSFDELCSIKDSLDIKTNFDTFIETGTLAGDTVHNMVQHFNKIYSIELSEIYYSHAKQRFSGLKNVEIYLGDSAALLPMVIRDVDSPAIFFLDGHWSGFNTAKGPKDCPLLDELYSIVNNFNQECLLIIDDHRLFGKKLNEDWSDVTEDSIGQIVQKRQIKSEIRNDRLIIHLSAKN